MNSATVERTTRIRESMRGVERINVTELARGKDWRGILPECDVMEITDRGESAGWLVSEAGMGALIETIDDLELRLEQAQIAAIVNARSGYKNWLGGEDLVSAALAVLEERGSEIEAVVADGR